MFLAVPESEPDPDFALGRRKINVRNQIISGTAHHRTFTV